MAKKKSKRYGLKSTIAFIIIIAILALIYYYVLPAILDKNSTESPTIRLDIEGVMKDDGTLKLHMISVGQADSIFIEFPTGDTMLIDAGEAATADNVVNYIKNLGYSEIDYVLLTHQDADHAGGMVAVYEAFDVEYSIRPTCYSVNKEAKSFSDDFNIGCSDSGFYQSKSATYCNYLKAVKNEGTTWSAFNKDSYINFNFIAEEQDYECKFDFLTPLSEISEIKYEKANNFSPIILLEYADRKIMLTGDAEKEVEKELLTYYKYNDFDVDVLKVGHHGSKTSSTEEFIKRIAPEYALISCGYNPENGKKCPWQVTLDTFVRHNCAVYRTDYQGNIILSIERDGDMKIDTEKQFNNYKAILTGYSN